MPRSDSENRRGRERERSRRHHGHRERSSSNRRWEKMDSKIDKLSMIVEKLVESDRSSRGRSSTRDRRSRSRSPYHSHHHSRDSGTRSSSVLSVGQNSDLNDFGIPGSKVGTTSGRDGHREGGSKPGSSSAVVRDLLSGSPSKQNDPELDDEILCLLGESRKEKVPEGPPLHREIAARWASILSNGISDDEKTQLSQKFPSPSNCSFINGPALNAEVEAALSSFTLQRDKEIQLFQKQLGVGISALGSSLTKMLSIKDQLTKAGFNSTELIGPMSDAARGLLDLQHSLSVHRRTIISPNIKTNLKSLIKNTTIDHDLFGADLPQKIKVAQELSKAGQEIRQPSKYSAKSKSKSNQSPKTKTSSDKDKPSRSAPLNSQRPSSYRQSRKTSSWNSKGGRYSKNNSRQ